MAVGEIHQLAMEGVTRRYLPCCENTWVASVGVIAGAGGASPGSGSLRWPRLRRRKGSRFDHLVRMQAPRKLSDNADDAKKAPFGQSERVYRSSATTMVK